MLRIKGGNGNSVCPSPSIFFCYIVVSPASVPLSLTELRCRGLVFLGNLLIFMDLCLREKGELSKFVRRFE